MDELLGGTALLGAAMALLLIDGDLPFGETAGAAPAGDKVMNAVLGRTTRPVKSSWALSCAVALGVTVVFLKIGAKPLFAGVPPPAPAPVACLISGPGGPRILDYTDSLENCGVRLEAVYLENGAPVSGAYNGLSVFVDADGIDAAQPRGPRARLITPWMRVQIDNELLRLMRARDGVRMQVSVVRP